jgi:hypothetical protein
MGAAADPQRDVRWAWGFVVLIVAGGILAQFLGYGIAVLLGYDVPEESMPSLGAALLIGVPSMLVAIAPAVAAVYFGIRAGLARRVTGYVAAAIGGLAVVYWVVLTIAGLIAVAFGSA